jgi:hypothetical protein
MRFPRHVIALLLLALWLPATMHCGLALAFSSTPEACCLAGQGDSESNQRAVHCAVEKGDYRAAPQEVLVAAPELFADWCGVRVLVDPTRVETVSGAPLAEAPPLNRPWQFVVRAAWPANAPSVVS